MLKAGQPETLNIQTLNKKNAGVAQLVVRQLTDPSYSRWFFDLIIDVEEKGNFTSINNAGVAQLVER